jgi:predicted SAM-dependent methyltransferase
MKKGLHIGAGPIHLDNLNGIEWENSDGAAIADTESSKSWQVERVRDFTLPFFDVADNSIDYIVFWHCVEHLNLSDKDNVLKEFLRMLTPGGRLFIACPDISKIARHIVDRDGPWQDWFICAVNIFGPYNGFVGDYHKWGYNFEELGKVMRALGYSEYTELSPGILATSIGAVNANKLGFAEYNIQAVAVK